MKYFISTLLVTTILLFFSDAVFAQTADSECVVTKVGAPAGTPPTLPQDCKAISGLPDGSIPSGNYRFPLANVSSVRGVANEMGVYAGEWKYAGHVEHAGIDLFASGGTVINAIADGTIIEIKPSNTSSCHAITAGCRIRISHSGDNMVSWYTHTEPDSNLKVNQKVTKGMRLGVVHHWGGNSHLHIELRDKNHGYNHNPRNHFPELQRFPLAAGYKGDVLAWSIYRNVPLANDGNEWPELFRNHPPCPWTIINCFAH